MKRGGRKEESVEVDKEKGLEKGGNETEGGGIAHLEGGVERRRKRRKR